MRAQQLTAPAPLSASPLRLVDLPEPDPAGTPHALLLRVQACGVCHTDLHVVEGDLPAHKLPVVPGHQVVATVEALGPGVVRFKRGDRVGVPWLHAACGVCAYCQRGEENLCDRPLFTGWDVDGGYADLMLADERFVVPIPPAFSDLQAAPLLCAGVIGYRSLRLAEVQPGEHLGLFGFGASAHIAIQIARHWGCPVSVFTRSLEHRALAESLGAQWAGGAEARPPHALDRAILFAPAGGLVPVALERLRKGGTLAVNAIHLSPIPELDYNLLYGERTVRSVANATRRDAHEFIGLAARIPVRVEAQAFALAEASRALAMVKRGEVNGAAVLVN